MWIEVMMIRGANQKVKMMHTRKRKRKTMRRIRQLGNKETKEENQKSIKIQWTVKKKSEDCYGYVSCVQNVHQPAYLEL